MRIVSILALAFLTVLSGVASAGWGGVEKASRDAGSVPFATTVVKGWVNSSFGGSPVAGALVHVEWGAPGNDGFNESGTNATGYYELGVETGPVQAYFVHEAYYARVDDLNVSGGNFWWNASLTPAPPRTGTITGKVTDIITGWAIPNPTVIAFRNDSQYINITNGDAIGGYAVGVVPGNYSIGAQVTGYSGTSAPTPLIVADGQTVWYNVSLLPENGQNVSLRGYVTDSMTSNPISFVRLDTTDVLGQENGTRTNASGYYEMMIYPANTSLRFTANQHAPHMTVVKPGVGQTVFWYNVSLDPDTTPPMVDSTYSAGPNGPANPLDFSGWVNETYLQSLSLNIGIRVWENATIAGYSVRKQFYNGSDGLFAYDAEEMPLAWTAPDNASFNGSFNGSGNFGYLNGTMLGAARIPISYSEISFFPDRYTLFGLHTNSTDPNGNLSLGIFHKNGTLDFVFVAPGSRNAVVYPGDDPTSRFGALNLTWYFRKSDWRPLTVIFTSDHNFTLTDITLTPTGRHPTGSYLAFAQAVDYGDNNQFDAHAFDLDTVTPTADPGPDESINEGDVVQFDGSSSADDVAVANYTWTFNDGSGNVTLYGASPLHVFNVPGNFTVTLTVRDAAMSSDSGTMTVGVADATPPVALAGGDITVGIGKNATLNGSASSDNVGIVAHEWQIQNGTANSTRSGAIVSARFDVLGSFVSTLEVRDAAGFTDQDTVNVVVVDDVAPVANAGTDRKVVARTEVTLDGTASKDNIGITAYMWVVNNGTGGPKPLNGSVVKVRYDQPGTYNVFLRVSDAAGNNDTARINVTVTPALDTTPPIAQAGLDQWVGQGTTVKLDGSASSDNVEVVDYNWTFKEKGVDVFVSGANPTRKFDVPNAYDITLTVKDAAGNSDTDIVRVVVNDTQVPVAKIAVYPGMKVSAGTTVTFDASGSTDNAGLNPAVTIWNITKGGAAVATLQKMNTSYKFTDEGTYQVELTVKDLAGNAGKAVERITVVAPAVISDGFGIGPILLLLLAIVAAVIIAFVVMRRKKKSEPRDGDDVESSTDTLPEEADPESEETATGEETEDHEVDEERQAAAEKAAATLAMKKEPAGSAVEGGLNYLFLGPDPKTAYDAFAKLLVAGKKGLVISSTLPTKLEKLYAIAGAKTIWLTEKAGEGRVVPTRLDFEVTKSVNDFFKANPGGVFLLDGVEYLISRNATDKVAQFVKKVADTAGEGGGTFLVTLNPNAIPADPLGMLRKSFDKVNEAK